MTGFDEAAGFGGGAGLDGIVTSPSETSTRSLLSPAADEQPTVAAISSGHRAYMGVLWSRYHCD